MIKPTGREVVAFHAAAARELRPYRWPQDHVLDFNSTGAGITSVASALVNLMAVAAVALVAN